MQVKGNKKGTAGIGVIQGHRFTDEADFTANFAPKANERGIGVYLDYIGPDGQLLVVLDPATKRVEALTGSGVTPFVIGLETGDPYSTLTSAIAAAVILGGEQLLLIKPGTYPQEGPVEIPPDIVIDGIDPRLVTIESPLTISTAGTRVIRNVTVIPAIEGAAILMSDAIPLGALVACLHIDNLILDAPLVAPGGHPTLYVEGLIPGPSGNFCFARDCEIRQSNSAERAIEVFYFGFLELDRCKIITPISGPSGVLWFGTVNVFRTSIDYLLAISGSADVTFRDSVITPGSTSFAVFVLTVAVIVKIFGLRIATNLIAGLSYFGGSPPGTGVGTLIIDELYLGSDGAPDPKGPIADTGVTILRRPVNNNSFHPPRVVDGSIIATHIVAADERVVLVDSIAAANTLELVSDPYIGQEHILGASSGAQAANPTTINGNGTPIQTGTTTAATISLTADAEIVHILFNGTFWNVLSRS